MGDQAGAWTALGAMGESVMALYAVARLLKSRDLGPAQLLPAIASNRSEAVSLAPRLLDLFAVLREASTDSPDLRSALDVLEPCATEVANAVAAAFTREGLSRLGARERLLLERRAEELGSELEGIRAQLELVAAALYARPVDLLLANVVGGRSGQAPTFVAQHARVRFDLRDDKDFMGDPRVLWPLFEAALRQLAGAGDSFVLQARSDGNGGMRVQIRPVTGEAPGIPPTGELSLSLGAAIAVEPQVVDAVARHLGIGFERSEQDPQITIALGSRA